MSLRVKIFRRRKFILGLCTCSLFIGLMLHETVRMSSWLTDMSESPEVLLTSEQQPPPPPPPRVYWNVDAGQWDPSEVRHIIFVKTHKAASTTLYGIFVRFSVSRTLNVMFPRDSHLLSEDSQQLSPLVDHPPSPPFLFDILCNHVVFDYEKLRPHFPADVMYVTILRKPQHQVRSAFNFYRNTKYHKEYLMRSSNFTDFLNNTELYEPTDPYKSFTNNRMSLDLGLPPHQLRNASYVSTFLQQVVNVFDLVLDAERVDESLILMRRRLKWTMKDLLHKVRHWTTENSKEIEPSLAKEFQRFDQFDIALYDHFSKVFDRLVEEEGPEFQAEVVCFKEVLQTVKTFCERNTDPKGRLVIPEQKWTKQFEVSAAECETIGLRDLVLDERAKYWQQENYYEALV